MMHICRASAMLRLSRLDSINYLILVGATRCSLCCEVLKHTFIIDNKKT